MTSKRDAKTDDPDTPLLEWICGGIGLVLFIGALAITALNAINQDTPPSIVVKAEPAQPSEGRFRVEFEAFNTGGETAADIRLVATLRSGETLVETQDVSLDLLPSHSSQRGGLIFAHDPTGLALEIAPVSYQYP